MKNLKSILFVFCMMICVSVVAAQEKQNKSAKKLETVVFKVEIDCMGCVGKIEKNIPFEKGVKKLDVDFKAQQVSIAYRPNKTNKQNLKKALEKLGLKVEDARKK